MVVKQGVVGQFCPPSLNHVKFAYDFNVHVYDFYFVKTQLCWELRTLVLNAEDPKLNQLKG